MDYLHILSLLGLLLYFSGLLWAVLREKKNQTVLDYFFAGRTLPFWALSITFIASWWGAGSALSSADLAYTEGLGAFWYYGVPVLISTFWMILGARSIRRVGYLTQGKMMEARYSPKVSRLLSVMILIFMTCSAASQMVGMGDFLGTYLGISYELALIAGTGIVVVYSLFGGFRGVVLTDMIQFILLLGSAVAVFWVAMTQSGGFSGIYTAVQEAGRQEYFSFTAGASRYASYVMTFGCAWMIQANVWQRISATRTDRDAKRMAMLSFFAYIPLYLMVVLTGMAGFVLFDTIPQGGVVTAIVTEYMPPVVGALSFVGISAAIMSTMDSLINTGAMTLTMDLGLGGASELQKLQRSRMATLWVAGVALLIALKIRSILEVSWIASDVITTGVFVPLLAGFLWRRGNGAGALSSMLVGLAYCFYHLLVGFGVNLPLPWEFQSTTQVLVGVFLSALVYVGVSLATPPEYDRADAFRTLAFGGQRKAPRGTHSLDASDEH